MMLFRNEALEGLGSSNLRCGKLFLFQAAQNGLVVNITCSTSVVKAAKDLAGLFTLRLPELAIAMCSNNNKQQHKVNDGMP